jgi:hypothetical protein
MATHAVGAKAAAMRKKLEGIWVKTMVLRSPNRLDILAASQRDTAVSTWEKKKTKASELTSSPNFVENQKATRLCITIDVVNVSTLNKAVRVKISRRDGSFIGLVQPPRSPGFSTFEDKNPYKIAPAICRTANPININLNDERVLKPKNSWKIAGSPAANAPSAVPVLAKIP